MVNTSTTIKSGMLSMTGCISWSYPAGISSMAAASEPSVSVHQWSVYGKNERAKGTKLQRMPFNVSYLKK